MITMRHWLQLTSRTLLDAALPPRCAGCGVEGTLLCPDCIARAAPLPWPSCPTCLALSGHGLPCPACQADPPPLDGLFAVASHDDPLRLAIHRYKYDGWHALAGPLAALLVAALADLPAVDRVIPVPSHPLRLSSRGYDHTERLAREVAARLRLPLDATAVYRVRDTAHQARQTSPTERRANVASAFAARPLPAGASLLLIDDVYTSGSTMTECARTLRNAGAIAVWGAVITRA